MKSKDMEKKEQQEALAAISTAVQDDNPEALAQAFTGFADIIQSNVLAEAKSMVNAQDVSILAQRGIHQLTSEERQYYQAVIDAMRSNAPMQALTSLDVVMPKTTIDNIFEDLQSEHPLLNAINFMNTSELTEFLMNTSTKQLASWSPLTDTITKELTSGFKKINLEQKKLSAWIPVSNAMLDLGPIWLDRYVRVVLSEALAYGLEDAIINGTGKDCPIGMTRQVGTGVTVTDGVYPLKTTTAVTDFNPETYGTLISSMATTPNGNYRTVGNVILVVNPVDYYKKVMPATTILRPDGTYANNVLPYPTTIIQSAQMAEGKAVIGIGSKYFAGIGTATSGKLEYSDEYKFLEDYRTYRIKLYGNGEPLDNNAFQYLDISGLKPKTYKVTTVAGE